MEAAEAEAVEEEEGVVVVEHDVLIVSWLMVVSALELAVQKPAVFFVSHVSPLNPYFVWCGLHLTLVP